VKPVLVGRGASVIIFKTVSTVFRETCTGGERSLKLDDVGKKHIFIHIDSP
jgi:hypothetical protein